jgi:two-component system OmpR family response regulator
VKLLLTEDDPLIGDGLVLALGDAGFQVDWVRRAAPSLTALEHTPYDLWVLDLGLPDRDGLTVLRQWRANGRNMPVLVLTARDSWHDKVTGIDAGADDYLAKPFHPEELLARLRALIRRSTGLASPLLQCGDLTLDTRSSRVSWTGLPITLTGHEYKVLAYLLHRPGQVVSRTELTEHIYSQDADRDSNTIEVFVGRLRRKMPGLALETVRGLGYRLACP